MSISRRCILSIAVAALITGCVSLADKSETRAVQDPDVENYNYILGTQTFGITYKFTDETGLVETARAIHDMGSNIIKFRLEDGYYGSYYGGVAKRDDVDSLTTLARNEPSHKAVFDMPFVYYHLWVYPFTGGGWQDGFSKEEADGEYKEIYEFVRYLLTEYNGTGKTFYLGHWEGDWYLHPDFDGSKDPSDELCKNMADWLSIRQRAVDDAKRDTEYDGVEVYHYTEVCLVQKAMSGGKAIASVILPDLDVDYVSWSSHEALGWSARNSFEQGDALRERLFDILDYIESRLKPKEGIDGKRVYIGEYGFAENFVKSADRQEKMSRQVARYFVEWGCPFVLFWEMYCNEFRNGKHNGWWLIDNQGDKQPLYYTHEKYYRLAKQYVAEFKKKHGRVPTPDEFKDIAVRLLDEAAGG